MPVPTPAESALPYVLALCLAVGSLLVYLTTAIVSRFALNHAGRTPRAFHLGLPAGQENGKLFATSIASAATTLSTVFVFFLLGASPASFGIHLLFCPVAFAAGLTLMAYVYQQVERNGYLDESVSSGLIPALGFKLTGSRVVGDLLAVLAALPVVALLTLEVRYGILLLEFIVRGMSASSVGLAQDLTFWSFALIVLLLLGYVFVGGFRSVVSSDVLQFHTMRVALLVALASTIVLTFARRGQLSSPPSSLGPSATPYVQLYVTIFLLNLLSPICLAPNWQRFRAFRDCRIDFVRATRLAALKVLPLWMALIVIGLLLHRLPHPVPVAATTADGAQQFFGLLDLVAGQNDWFRFVVFPMLSLAAFSGMFSSADTCVSSLLYLTEWDGGAGRPSPARDARPRHLRAAMAGVFAVVMGVYPIVRRVAGGADGLNTVASAIFSTAVILAPTIFLLTALRPATDEIQRRRRSPYLVASIVLGAAGYWLLTTMHEAEVVGLRPFALTGGLALAVVPAYLLLRADRVPEVDHVRAGV